MEAAGGQRGASSWEVWEGNSVAAGRRWKTLERWWHWGTEQMPLTQGTRFQVIVIPSNGICRKKADGICCGKEGYRREGGPLRCGGCRQQGQGEEGCQACGAQGTIDSIGLGSVG